MWFVILLLFVDLFLQEYFRAFSFGVANKGISFGLEISNGWWSITLLVLVALIIWQLISKKQQKLGLWLMIWGGIGNLSQRIIHGHVWDYLPFWGELWFNLSDVLIVLGALISIMRDNKPNGKNKTIEE